MKRVADIREQFAELRKKGKYVGNTIELVGESFIADEPLIFGAVNHAYVSREIQWYQSHSLSVEDIPGDTPKIWKQVAGVNGRINSNYGYLFESIMNGSQLDHVIHHLSRDKNTRRAVAIYTRPSMHNDWNSDGMSDFVCTNAVQFLIRDGLLDLVVQMRSNDAIFGYRNDYAWQRYCQDLVIGTLAHTYDIHVGQGEIIWNAASLHIYDRHMYLIDDYALHGNIEGSVA